MKFDPKIHHRPFDNTQGRCSIRLKGYDYSQAGGYYVTIVTLWREYLFGEVVGGETRLNALGRIVQSTRLSLLLHEYGPKGNSIESVGDDAFCQRVILEEFLIQKCGLA